MTSYTTDALVRSRSGVTTTEVSTVNMTNIIALVDNEINNIVENAYLYSTNPRSLEKML